MWTPPTRFAAGLAALALTAAGLVAAATPSVAADDVTPPSLVSFAASASRFDVTTADKPVTITLGLTDEESGVASVSIYGATIDQGSDPAVPRSYGGHGQATLASGTARSGLWSAQVNIPVGVAGPIEFGLQAFDVAGNRLLGEVAELLPTGQPALTAVVTAPPQAPTGVKGATFLHVVGIGRNVTWTTKPGTPPATGYAVLSQTSACGQLYYPVKPQLYMRFETMNPLLPCTLKLQVANSAGRSPAKSYTVW